MYSPNPSSPGGHDPLLSQHPPGYPMSPGGLAPCSLTSSPISPLFYEVASPSPSGFDFSPQQSHSQHSYDSSNGLDQSMQTRHKNSRTRDHHISTTSDDDSFATVRSNRNKRYRRSQNHTQRPLQVSNRYDALRNMDCVDDHEASEESPPKDKIPPIFVSKNNLPINDLMKSLKAIDPDFSAKDSRDFLRLDCSTTDGYRAACTLLDNKNLEYHSYRLQQDKTIDVVIKHVPVAFTDQEITDELQILGFKDFKLMRVWDREKKPIPVVSVYLDKKHEMNKEIFDLSKFMNCIVSVEPKKKSHHIPQCTKCQRYGHTKNYCKLSPRCLFCSLPHPSSQCEKKKEDTVKVCANCGENHTANFKGCTYYADLKKKRFRSTPQALHKRINSDPPPDFSPEKFPYLPSQRAPLLPVSQASDHMYARASQSPPVWNVRQSPPTWNTHSSPPVHNIISSPSAQPSQSPPTPSSDDASVPLLDSLLDTLNQPPVHKLALLNWNANGIDKKKMIFTDFLVRHNIDIACVTETHLTSCQKFKIANYKIYRNDREPAASPWDQKASGGVAVFIKKNIYHEPIVLPPMICFEIQGILVSLRNGSKLRIFSVYRSRKPLSVRDLNTIFAGNEVPTLLVGDFNCKHPAWNSVEDNPNVVIELDAVLLQCPPRLKLINGPVDWDLFRDHLNSNISIPSSFQNIDTVENTVESFTDAIKQSIYLSSGPPKYYSHKFVLPFHLRSLIAYKHRVRRRWQRNRMAADKRLLNILCKKVKLQLDQFWYDGYQEYLQDLHPDDGTLYKETKRILRQQDSIPPLVVGQDVFATSPPEKCEAFADMLEQTFSVDGDNFNSVHVSHVREFLKQDQASAELPIPYVNPSEIHTEIKLLKTKKAPGHDLIPNEVLKELPVRAILLLAAIFNACFRLNYFPYMWKHAQVTMLAKPGKSKKEVKSYRPISLLPTLSKLLEKVIASRLKNVLSDWNVLPSFQFGFREGHSTIHQMAKFSEFVNNNFEKRKQVVAIFLDFQAAFDRVWHDGLLFKMKKLQFPHYLTGIVSSFLKERTFSVKIENNFSTIRPVRASVPQGSVLGPILFNLYVSDIGLSYTPLPSNCFTGMFADDKILACADSDLISAQNCLQALVDDVVQWCHQWCVTISIAKSEAKIFSLCRSPDPPCIKINDECIPWKEQSVRYLGVWFDRRLTWRDHISKKTSEGYQRLSKLFPILNKKSSIAMKSAILIYKTILLPVVTYGCPVWLPAANSHIKKLQIFQNKVLRIITKAPWFVRNANIQKDLKIAPVYDLILKRTIEFIQDKPHGIGERTYVRRMRVHLPQNMRDVVNGLANSIS
ncbi:hypothetical protein WDU94_012420 [Cyamophila willieti]